VYAVRVTFEPLMLPLADEVAANVVEQALAQHYLVRAAAVEGDLTEMAGDEPAGGEQ
jgi:hypothetical protein